MKKLLILLTLIIFSSIDSPIYSQEKMGVSGSVDWETMRFSAEVTLDLASVGLKLPAGRTQAESILSANYLSLLRPFLLELQADSSSTIGDLVSRGEYTLSQADTIVLEGNSVPPAMRPDLRRMSASHTILLSNLSASLMRHNRPSRIFRTLSPVSSASYTGIIIIAAEALPVYAMTGTAFPVPCLFPKIWDSDMNLVYERNTLEAHHVTMVQYSSLDKIFRNNPSGLTPELRQIAGDRPLRIFACGVFGINPTDLIIDRNDALTIISSEENRRLLSQGKVVIILDDSVLRYEFSGE